MSLRKLCYRCKQGDPTGNVWLTEDQQGAGDKGHLLLNYCKRALSPASCRWLMEDQASSSKKVLQAFPEYSSTASSAYLKEWEQPSPCGHQKSKGNFLLEATEEIKCGHWVRALGLLTSQCRGYRTVIHTFRGVLLLSKIFYLNPLCLRIEPKKQTNVRQRSMQNKRQQAIDCDGSLCKRLFKVQSQTWHSNIQRGRCTHYWRNAILLKTVFACIYNVFVWVCLVCIHVKTRGWY